MELFGLLFLIPFIPLLLMFIGFIKLMKGDERSKSQGKALFLTGFIIIALALLIGFSICSGM